MHGASIFTFPKKFYKLGPTPLFLILPCNSLFYATKYFFYHVYSFIYEATKISFRHNIQSTNQPTNQLTTPLRSTIIFQLSFFLRKNFFFHFYSMKIIVIIYIFYFIFFKKMHYIACLLQFSSFHLNVISSIYLFFFFALSLPKINILSLISFCASCARIILPLKQIALARFS